MTDILDGPEVVEVDNDGNVIDLGEAREKKGRGKVADDQPAKPQYDKAFLKKVRAVGIEEDAIRAGGDYRQYRRQKIYWLPLEDLLEFEQADARITDDDEFWDFFLEQIKAKGFQTKAERTKKTSRSWNDWTPNYDFGWKNKASKWWTDYGYGGYSYGGTSDLVKKLAVALKAVNTTVQVVNDTGVRYRVKLASDAPDAPTSYTSYGEKLIVVSPQALLDTSIEQDAGIEVTTGYGLHEASHVKYSEKLVEVLSKPTELRPALVASLLHNVLEDLRIEVLTSQRFPGFTEYFDTANKYLWDVSAKNKPTIWGPSLEDKLNSMIAIAKWPNEYKAVVDADPGLTEEWPWWRDWAEGYVAGKEPIRMAIIRALEHLQEDEDTKKEMEQMTENEQEQGLGRYGSMTDDQFKKWIEELKKNLMNGVGDPCPSPMQGGPASPNAPGANGTEVKLTAAQGEQLDKLIREQFFEDEVFFKMKDGEGKDAAPKILVYKPEETDLSRSRYFRPGAMVERLRSVFYFRKTAPTERDRLQKQGFIDEDELWRAGLGDGRVFEKLHQPDEAPTSITLLVDISGSMAGRGVEKAQELANVMMACLRTQRGVRTRIRAHTTEMGENGEDCKIFRIWEPSDPDTRIGLLNSLPRGSNYDGFAMDWCARELVETARVGETLVLIVLSDGLPSGYGVVYYGGHQAMKHMRAVGDHYERLGVTTVQIAIDPDGLRPEDQAVMFKNWIGYESDQGLLRDMTRLLSKIFGAVE